MADARNTPETVLKQDVLKRLGRVLVVTRAGLLAETITRRFWPLWSLCFVVMAALMLGVQDALPLEVVWTLGVLVVAGGGLLVLRGMRGFRFPTKADAIARLDATLPARPLQALGDSPSIGAGDSGSMAIWRAHQARMMRKLDGVRPPEPDLRVSRMDPFGLRYIAVLGLAVAFLFGSLARVSSVADMTAGGAMPLAGPSWEGWIEPPAYTGKPALYLPDQPEGGLDLPQGSRILVRLYGEVGALTLSETVSARTEDVPSAAAPEQDFEVVQSGIVDIEGETGRKWDINIVPDRAPVVQTLGTPDVSARGEMSLVFHASDDYGITGGEARISLDLAAVDRRYGLRVAPEVQDPVVVPLPLPISGGRETFTETLIEDFSKHPWAHLPVTVSLQVSDAAGQSGVADPLHTGLPARRFFDPLAAALIEMRRDLLWSRENGPRVAQILRAMSHRPEEGVFQQETNYLRLRMIVRRLENALPRGITDAQQAETAEALWTLAMLLEEGDLGDAMERMQRARDRLSEAMKNGASDAEIAQLMQELREATQDYLRELARRQNEDQEDGGDRQLSENTTTLGQQDLQRMMDRIQELMEQGRMAEAMQALQEFQNMMENMQVTQGEGNGAPSAGEQAMEGLSDTLREQQGLSDQAFRDLQEQFNPNAGAGQSQGNEGRNGGEGRGQSHDGTGQGNGAGQDETGSQQGQQPGQQPGKGTLADRQQALRNQLDGLQGNLPGRGTPEGDAAAEALGRAGEAMDGAEDALRQNDLAQAIDKQAQAMEAMREGMRNLGEAMAEKQGQGQAGRDQAGNSADPLGRSQGARGPAGTDEGLLQGKDVYRHARELLDEIQRRAGDTERPEEERSYLRRLLDRF